MGVWSPVSIAKYRGGCLPASPMNSLEGVAGRATRTVLTVTSRRPGAGCISHGDTFLCLAAALSKFLIFGPQFILFDNFIFVVFTEVWQIEACYGQLPIIFIIPIPSQCEFVLLL